MENIIIIGAGMIGVSTAWHLAQRGVRPLIVDSLLPGNGCSFGNAGLIAVDHVAPLASPDTLASMSRMLLKADGPLRVHKRSLVRMAPWMWRFARAARAQNFARNTRALASLVTQAAGAWQRLMDDIPSLRADLYRDLGALYVFEKPAIRPSAQRREQRQLEMLTHYGVQYENLTAAQVRARYLPGLACSVSHARYFPGMASVVDPQRVVQCLFEHALSAGARFVQAKVEAIRPRLDGQIDVQTGRSGNQSSGQLSDQPGNSLLRASRIVLCAGVQTRELLRPLGLRLLLTGERGYHVQLAHPPGEWLRVPVSFVERGFTCNPMAHGIRLAGTVELGARDAPNDEPDWRRADLLAAHFAALFPGSQPRIESRWHGERPTTPDYLPVIGEAAAIPGVFVASGHQHLGLTLGPLTGELVTQLVMRLSSSIDLAPFRLERF